MNQSLRIGVLVLPPLQSISLPILSPYIKGQQVISNYELSQPHQLLKFADKPENNIFGDTTIRIPHENSEIEITDMLTKHLSLMLEILKRVNKLVIVAPNKVPLLFAIIAISKIKQPSDLRIIVGNTVISNKDILKSLSNKETYESLRTQWNKISDTSNETDETPIEYDANNLLQTPNDATLRPYQQQIVDFAISRKRVGLFVDMGLGKTLSTLATINQLAITHKIDIRKPILIVAPIMVALDTWSREAEKWGYDMDVIVNIRLSPKKRKLLFDDMIKPKSKLTLLTTNPAQLKSLLDYFQTNHLQSPFEVVIVDELSQFKSPTAQRFNQLNAISRNSKYFLGLTGTPAPNNLLDIWSQLILIDKKNSQTFGYEFYQFRSRFFEPDTIGRDGTVYKWKLKPYADKKIYHLMKPSVISMRSEGLIDLPDIVYANRYVKLPPKAMDLYHKLDRELRIQLLQDDVEQVSLELSDNDLDIKNNAVLTGKLAQITSGAIYDNLLTDTDTNGSGHYEIVHDEKMKMLKDIVDNASSPVLVFFYFQSELDRLSQYIDYERLDPHRDDVKDVISRWNKGEIPVLLAHPASASHGLNLQDGGHTIIWLTTTWSNELYRQAVRRLYRSGQKHTVSVIHIVAANTVDEEIISRIDDKEVGQNQLMTALDVAVRKSSK